MTALLAVQQAALDRCNNADGFAYFLEMGMGKSLLALTEFQQLVDRGEVSRLVVVCPNSFKEGWANEILKHKFNLESHTYESGSANDFFLRRPFNRPPVIIVNYEAIRSASTMQYIKTFAAGRNCMVVFDESISLKGNKSIQTKAAIELSKSFKYKRILSGRPQTQGPHDLWGQFRAIGKLEAWNYYVFRNTFCKMGGYMMKKVTGAMNEDILQDRIGPHMFRATKDDWLDLPPKLYTAREYRLTPRQQLQYNMMENDFITWVTDDVNVTVDAAITKYIKLAQIQCGFIIDEGHKVNELVETANNPRIALLRRVIEEEVPGKLAVVYVHRYSGEILLEAFADQNPTYIRGNMADTEITANKDRFNNDPQCRVIFLQATAARYGHTLVGGGEPQNMCNVMAFYENTWSLDTRSQLEDRIHRIGQRANSCLYVDLVGTHLDKKVITALQEKGSIFDAVFQHIREVRHGAFQSLPVDAQRG